MYITCLTFAPALHSFSLFLSESLSLSLRVSLFESLSLSYFFAKESSTQIGLFCKREFHRCRFLHTHTHTHTHTRTWMYMSHTHIYTYIW